ncbi:lpg1907 family Dot/Icm T4SS effector [Legionella pneumophila serogroup 1]|nr:lpg1907 family Dot/Icm T4SS effector [Legionella pneumophila]HAU0938886.1 lpg1907 family Dot/Icm T4SS effector [Legionella pneumophila]HDO7871510.1 lpg1907 family Dot/Icm T4SS effector [Legionella pneumophila]HDO7938852.1 lpg1907 family Dot/Icm T4SS effector [Legionella pneumophila]HDO8156239.1 lpg1907 family Dot/Icm T4SS effector [Legionella pneumophila]
MVRECTSFKGGLNLNFVENAEFESRKNIPPEEQRAVLIRNTLRLLMMGWNTSWTELFSWETFKAIYLQRDPLLLKEFRLAFQKGFDALFTQLSGRQFNSQQNEQIQLYLSNCLSYLPLFDLNPYESIKVPQRINDQWVMVDYYIKPIELTNHRGKNDLILRDDDRVFAYGLEPIDNPNAQSHLIFMGTTYPAGQGFISQLNTDLKGFETVGYSLYKNGRDRIKDWILKQNSKIHVCGISLGGSLSLLLAIDMGKYLSRVDALNPAGLHDTDNKVKYDKWDKIKKKPLVVVQQQGNDPVSFFGVWKKEWNIFHVKPPKDKQGPNLFCDHFLNYAGFAETEFTYVSAEQQNAKRKARNFWLYSLGRGVLYYFGLAPYTYLIRPVIHYIAEQWPLIVFGIIPLLIIGTLIGLSTAGIIPAIASIGTLAVFAISSGIFYLSFGLSSNEEEKNTWGGMFDFILKGSEKVLDENEIKLAKLHHPSTPRNPEMDIYKNETAIDLTYKQINTYYQVTRCLLKQKEFLPLKDKPEKRFGGLSKKEALLASMNSASHDEVISLQIPKAKAVHIKHSLTLAAKIGMENEIELKSALKKEYNQYQIGKHQRLC